MVCVSRYNEAWDSKTMARFYEYWQGKRSGRKRFEIGDGYVRKNKIKVL